MVKTKVLNFSSIGFFVFSVVFALGPINELLLSYYKPNFPYFDFYSTIFAFFAIVYFCIKRKPPIISQQLLMIIGFFFIILMIVLLSPVVTDSKGQNTIFVNIFFIRKSISYFILGGFFCFSFYCGKYRHLPFVLLMIVYSVLVDWGTLRLDTFQYPNVTQWGNYHYLSECLAVLSFFSIASEYKKKFLVCVIFLLTVVILFALGSRSTFFIYLLVSLIVLYICNVYKVNIYKIILFVILFVFVFSMAIDFRSLFFPFIDSNNRMFSIFLCLNEGSMVSRSVLANSGMADIYDNWIGGDLGGQVKYGGDLWGGYIHDFRSYWRQFGLIPFAFYTLILIRLNLLSFYTAIRTLEVRSLFLFATLLFFTLESFFSRAYLSTYIYFFVGFAVFVNSQGRGRK
jgi:hypothetical protein